MKVLLIDVNCKQSSTGKIVYDLYQNLLKDGHEAAICYGRGEVIEGKNIYKFGLDWETKIHAALARITGMNGYFSLISTRRLIKYIDGFKPDIVHIHELHAYFVNIYTLLECLKQRKIKIVWTFHCEYMYTGKCGHAYECERYKHDCGSCPALKEYPKSLFFDFTRKMVLEKKKALIDMSFTIVTPSQWLADRVKTSFLGDKNMQVVYNGVDTEKVFYPRKADDVKALRRRYGLIDKKIVLSVAPHIMDERKGGLTILRMSQVFEDDNIHFVLVGAEKDEKIQRNVTLIKQTANQEELALWYSAADVFLICSVKETFSMTCAEAIACDTKILGFESGAPEMTFESPYAVFVKQGDISLLENELRKELRNTKKTGATRLYGVNCFSQKAMYLGYKKIYFEQEKKQTNDFECEEQK